ncbi:hypothetical protein F4860DRAFT_508881 [Xylaria cubensis]|nr:hypothetical protein F4860DRAFT_508881 [Xylaria cubensis]
MFGESKDEEERRKVLRPTWDWLFTILLARTNRIRDRERLLAGGHNNIQTYHVLSARNTTSAPLLGRRSWFWCCLRIFATLLSLVWKELDISREGFGFVSIQFHGALSDLIEVSYGQEMINLQRKVQQYFETMLSTESILAIDIQAPRPVELRREPNYTHIARAILWTGKRSSVPEFFRALKREREVYRQTLGFSVRITMKQYISTAEVSYKDNIVKFRTPSVKGGFLEVLNTGASNPSDMAFIALNLHKITSTLFNPLSCLHRR